MNCEKHADREGVLTVDLPSAGIKRYMCEECRDAFDVLLDNASYKGKREAWDDRAGNDHWYKQSDLEGNVTWREKFR